jgi:hypothetical protein
VRAKRSDGGGEFASKDFHAYCVSSGIVFCALSSAVNGRVERVNGVWLKGLSPC